MRAAWSLLLLISVLPPSEPVRSDYPEAIELIGPYCADANGFSIVTGLVYLDARRFNSQSLSEYFARFLDFPAEGDVYLTVMADRERVERRRNPLPPDGPPPPKPPFPFPNRIKGPLAYFYRFGGNALFQFRDIRGKSQWVVLQGRNVFQDNPWKLGMLVADLSFSSADWNDGTCRDGQMEIGMVLDKLAQLSFEETEQILLYFDRVFSHPSNLVLTIYEDPGLAQLRQEAIFPPLDYELDGNFKYGSRTASIYRSKTGHRTISIYEGGRPLHHRSWTP